MTPQILLAVATFFAVEAAFFGLTRWLRPPRGRVSRHLAALLLAGWVAGEGGEWAASEPLAWQIHCTATLVVLALVLVDLGEVTAVRLLAWRRDREPRWLPGLARAILRVVVVLVVALVAARLVHGLPISTIALSSTVVSAVVGLALQDLLKEVFAGVALQTEGLVRAGHWLELDGEPARVVDVTWRSTQLIDPRGIVRVEPNSSLLAQRLVRLGTGRPPIALTFDVGLPYGAPPARCRAALLAAADMPDALDEPAPKALIRSYGESAIDYELWVWTAAVDRLAMVRDEIYGRIWYELERAELPVPFPIRTVELHEMEREEPRRLELDVARRAELLARVDLFAGLSHEARGQIAAAMHRRFVDRGEVIAHEGQAASSLFVLERGEVELRRLGEDGEAVAVGSLGAGAAFGEAALLVGEPWRATVRTVDGCEALELRNDDLAPLLERDPNLARALGTAVARPTSAGGRDASMASEDSADSGSDSPSAPRRSLLDEDVGVVLSRLRDAFRPER
ncbi:MAG: mechanosensitive ion channel family protein [Acidobacteriota bacterium]